MSAHMPHVYHDGGRQAAGFRGTAGDCVVRALAIAMQRPYAAVYAAMLSGSLSERLRSDGKRRRSGPERGMHTNLRWFKRFMEQNGWEWVPCMGIGTGCRVHLVAGELPMGRLVVSVSRHLVAVIDGVIYDTHDPQRRTPIVENGQQRMAERCVYGYWREARR